MVSVQFHYIIYLHCVLVYLVLYLTMIRNLTGFLNPGRMYPHIYIKDRLPTTSMIRFILVVLSLMCSDPDYVVNAGLCFITLCHCPLLNMVLSAGGYLSSILNMGKGWKRWMSRATFDPLIEWMEFTFPKPEGDLGLYWFSYQSMLFKLRKLCT